MPLSPDFHDILEIFVYTNLPILINPLTAVATFTTTVGAPAVATRAITTSTPTIPAKIFTPDVLVALQTSALDNFTALGLQPDLDEIAKVFFANLPAAPPAVTPIAPSTPTAPAVPTTSPIITAVMPTPTAITTATLVATNF